MKQKVKAVLSFFLSATVIFGILPTGIALAEKICPDSPVDNTSLTFGSTYKSTPSQNGHTALFAADEQDSAHITNLSIKKLPYETEYFEGVTPDKINFTGLELKAVFSDGTEKIWKYGKDGTEINGEPIHIEYSESLSTDGIITFSCGGKSTKLTLTITENPVVSVQGVPLTVIENLSGYYSTDDNGLSYYHYNISSFSPRITINYKDGTSKTVAITGLIDGYSPCIVDDQRTFHWYQESTNIIEFEYLCRKGSIPVTVIPNTLSSLQVTEKPTVKFTYGDTAYGYTDDNGNYHFYPFDDDTVKNMLEFNVIHTDGTTQVLNGADIDRNGKLNGYDITFKLPEFITKGTSSVTVTVCYLELSASFSIQILPEQTSSECSHSFGAWTVKIPATSQSEGLEIRSCTKCGTEEKRTISKLPVPEITIKDNVNVIKSGNALKTVPDSTAAELIKATGGNTKLFNADGSETTDDKLKTGMKIAITENGKIIQESDIVILGDVNGDGNISVTDARLALRRAVGLEELKGAFLAAAQVRDGKSAVAVGDAREILRAAVSLDDPKQWLNNVR